MQMQLDEFSEVKREFDVRMARAKALSEFSSSEERKKVVLMFKHQIIQLMAGLKPYGQSSVEKMPCVTEPESSEDFDSGKRKRDLKKQEKEEVKIKP